MEDGLARGRTVGLNDVHVLGIYCCGNGRSDPTGGVCQCVCLTLANRPYIRQMRLRNHKRVAQHGRHIR